MAEEAEPCALSPAVWSSLPFECLELVFTLLPLKDR